MKWVKIGIVGACALATGLVVFFFWGSPEPAAVAAEYSTNLKCAACDAVFELDGTTYEAELQKVQYVEPITCSKCAELRAYTAVQCLKCDTWFFPQPVEGSSGQCPVCRPHAVDEVPEVEPQHVRERPRSM